MKKLLLLLIIALAYSPMGKGQCLSINLIKNPSLEDHTACPTDNSMIYLAEYWTHPLISLGCTSDYYHTCGLDSVIGPPVSFFFQYSFFGDGYAGIFTAENIPGTTNYREYIQGTLSGPLIYGRCYYGEFWVRPFNRDSMAMSYSGIDDIGIFFSDTLPTAPSEYDPFIRDAQINNPTGNVITDTNNWTKINGTFIADGGERYFTVGAFKPQSEINVVYFNTFEPNYSYYFFDNFSLCPCEDTLPPAEPAPELYIPNIFSPNGDGQNDVLRLRGERIAAIEIKVYNRWGETVYESNDPAAAWDGTFQGKACPPGVYFYTTSVVFDDGSAEERKGNVTIVQ